MIRRLLQLLPLGAVFVAHLAAQLSMITVPHGALEIGLVGAFFPNDDVWDNGSRRPLGSLVDPNILAGDLQTRLSQALGVPVTDLSLGATTVAAREHGIGNIELGYGITRRLSIFVNVPIVYVRSRVSAIADSVGHGRLGINPANALAQNPAGQAETSAFFAQFDAALGTLSRNLQQGTYFGNPALLAAAQQTLSTASGLRASLYALLGDPDKSVVLLPLSTDAYSTTLIGQINAVQSTLTNQLGVTGFTAVPALPTQAAAPTDVEALDTASTGFAFGSPNLSPQYGVGDIETGLAYRLLGSDSAGTSDWERLWIRATARLPTGSAPDPDVLLDQGTGSTSPAVRAELIGEIGRGRFGIRGAAGYQRAFAGNGYARVAPLDQLLAPPENTAALRVQPGDSMVLTARPFVRFASHLALAGMVQYWRTSATHTTYVAGQSAVSGLDASVLDAGSAANAWIVGLGISYSNPGRDGPIGNGLPVEAGWSIERTIHSGGGIFPDALTSRVELKFYRPIVRH